VIAGDLDLPLAINGVALRLCAVERHLPTVQALVVEQDTGLLLDEAVVLNVTREERASTQEILQQPGFNYPIGTVLPRQGQGQPQRLYTVIHNLNRRPSWSEEGIEQALDNLFALLPLLGIGSLAMPALAHRHGKLPVAAFISLLGDYLAHHTLPWRGELWLQLPREALQPALQALRTRCAIHQP
jgi:hypothetical protein